MKVTKPTDNPITQDYSLKHKAYDFSGLNRPDEVRSGLDGEIIERVNIYNSSWINTGTLSTKDYGNFIKVRHNDGTLALFAHLKKDSSLNIGTKVKEGQIIARIGNTGNSSGPHLHAEYRNQSNINIPVEFRIGGANMDMYKGYDLSNRESMKVAVDILVRVQNGEFIDKPKYDADIKSLQEKLKVCESKPTGNPEAEKTLAELKAVLSKILR